MHTQIPIFFSTDENYIPYLDVALSSLIANASLAYSYRIVVLNTGLCPDSIAQIRRNQRPNVTIDFLDISHYVRRIKKHFKNVYHFSIVTYYRLFIASLFPQYDKILYLDCDIVVLGDISELYQIPLGNNILGAAPDQYVQSTAEFREYAESALGVDPDGYVNAGVLIMNLQAFRENRIEEQFVEMITRYDFDLLDPDQAYLNYLCRGRILALPNGWNKAPTGTPCQGKKNIVHYNLYKKPWQYDDVVDGEYFWDYAKDSLFYRQILLDKAAFGEAERRKKDAAAQEILKHARRIVASENTFSGQLGRR